MRYLSTARSLVKTPTRAIPLAYGLLAFLAYGPLLRSFFLADDFLFIEDVRGWGSWLWPHDLPGQIIRPVVMLAFRLDHAMWGLSPIGYHLTNVVMHVVNAWLLFAITRRLTGHVRTAFWTGLLFLVFTGHAEAVGWVSGRADVIGTTMSLTSLWLYGQSIDRRGCHTSLVWGSYVAFAGALLSKESMIVLPALAAGLEICCPRDVRRRRWVRSVVWRMAGFAGVMVAYFAFRAAALGTALGEYAGYDPARALGHLRIFLFRSLLPVTWFDVPDFSNSGDVLAYLAIAAAMLRIAWLRRSPVALFPGLAFLITLLPVLPLEVSMVEPQGERFVYLPSAFGAMLIMMMLNAATSRVGDVLRRVLSVSLCAVNFIALIGVSQTFAEAGLLSEQVTASIGSNLAGTPANGKVFVLNAPDTYRGVYVFRNGFLAALRVFQPGVFREGRSVHGIVGHSVSSLKELVSVRSTGPTAFHVDLHAGRIPYLPISSGAFYTVTNQTPGGFDIAFSDSVRYGLVLYTSRGRLNRAGVVQGTGAPFGVIDIPAGEVPCEEGFIRFAGWALDGEEVTRVEVARERVSGLDGTKRELVVLGEAQEQRHPRPDIARAFPDFPNHDRAGWETQLPCSTLPRASRTVIHVIAANRNGAKTDLGQRLVRRSGATVR